MGPDAGGPLLSVLSWQSSTAFPKTTSEARLSEPKYLSFPTQTLAQRQSPVQLRVQRGLRVFAQAVPTAQDARRPRTCPGRSFFLFWWTQLNGDLIPEAPAIPPPSLCCSAFFFFFFKKLIDWLRGPSLLRAGYL